jgi:hypothetical protein
MSARIAIVLSICRRTRIGTSSPVLSSHVGNTGQYILYRDRHGERASFAPSRAVRVYTG